MQFDKQNLFSEDQAITGDAASTNYINLGTPGTPAGQSSALKRDIGKGSKIPLAVMVTEAFNTLTSLTISLQVDDNTSFSSPKTVQSAVIVLADLTVGKIKVFDFVPPGADEQYMRMYYDVTGTDPTTGKITAGFVTAVDERGN